MSIGCTFDHARPAQDRYARCAARPQHRYAGSRGCPAGINIVNQHDTPASDARAARWCHGEHALYRAAPAGPTQPLQHRSRPATNQQIARPSHAARSRQRGGDQPCLVVPARPQTPPVQWDRQQQLGAAGQVTHHQPRRRVREAGSPAVFQPKHHIARDATVSDGRIHPGVRGRFRETRAAAGITSPIVREWRVAARAPGRPEKAKRRPARPAEAMIAVGYRSARSAAGRQRESNHRLE